MNSKLYRDTNESHSKINNKSDYKRDTFDIFGILQYPLTYDGQFEKLFKDSKNKIKREYQEQPFTAVYLIDFA